MPGWHLHDLSGKRDAGGHVLDLRLTNGRLALDTTPRFSLNLPESGAYVQTRLEKTDKAETERIEKDRK